MRWRFFSSERRSLSRNSLGSRTRPKSTATHCLPIPAEGRTRSIKRFSSVLRMATMARRVAGEASSNLRATLVVQQSIAPLRRQPCGFDLNRSLGAISKSRTDRVSAITGCRKYAPRQYSWSVRRLVAFAFGDICQRLLKEPFQADARFPSRELAVLAERSLRVTPDAPRQGHDRPGRDWSDVVRD
jgi:hypothetical protein